MHVQQQMVAVVSSQLVMPRASALFLHTRQEEEDTNIAVYLGREEPAAACCQSHYSADACAVGDQKQQAVLNDTYDGFTADTVIGWMAREYCYVLGRFYGMVNLYALVCAQKGSCPAVNSPIRNIMS